MMLWYSDAGGTNYHNPIDDAEDYAGVMHQVYPWPLSKIYKAFHFFIMWSWNSIGHQGTQESIKPL